MDHHRRSHLNQEDTDLIYRLWLFFKKSEKDIPRIGIELWNKRLLLVSISDNPEIMVKGKVIIPRFDEVKKFIIINQDVLMNYWLSMGDMSLKEVFKRLKKVK